MEKFKTLIFTDDRAERLGKYATILMFAKEEEFGGSSLPTLMTLKATINDLKVLIPNLDFKGVELISVNLKENPILDFGAYVIIEQKRYGVENEQYSHKVIGKLRSNTWVDVPVQTPAREVTHDHMEDVVACICCGVQEKEVLYYRIKDIK